ncbi:hypothetical protein KSD_50120 [Ktedonobacter sp. SOSP1-85]|uniref:hypothetical protein n=1 Tax=Ktedonobacter sp. SOSP1-85 TaxID=2778367 RepID=UPI00191592FC|nr:hypothetical protein [Ktedonobacter sp. SOSP1-85]GHO77241.1 hypothetical protein KSD_50120 [Ktedonobacter sp. SOSP1-85]
MEIQTNEGKLYLEDQGMRLAGNVKNHVWGAYYHEIAQIRIQPKGIQSTLVAQLHDGRTFHTTFGHVSVHQIMQFLAQTTQIPVQFEVPAPMPAPAPMSAPIPMSVPAPVRKPVKPLFGKWYEDPNLKVHVETYKSERELKKGVEVAGRHGWVPQVDGMKGHINVGRTMTAAALTGGFSLLLGASRTKDKWTVTFVRSQQ